MNKYVRIILINIAAIFALCYAVYQAYLLWREKRAFQKMARDIEELEDELPAKEEPGPIVKTHIQDPDDEEEVNNHLDNIIKLTAGKHEQKEESPKGPKTSDQSSEKPKSKK